MDIKNNLSQNLIIYRKAFNLTQAEFGEKINYSDKAISKWERGEAIPDVIVLKEIADFYGTTIDNLIAEPKKEKPKVTILTSKKRLIISLLSFVLAWFIAVCTYTILSLTIEDESLWLIFIYAIPISTLLFLIFSAIWGKNIITFVCISIMIWSMFLSAYLSITVYTFETPTNLWFMFLICIPLQILAILWAFLKNINLKIKSRKNKNQKKKNTKTNISNQKEINKN